MYWLLMIGIFALFVFASLKGLQRKQKMIAYSSNVLYLVHMSNCFLIV